MAVRAVIFDWGGTLTPWHALDPHESWLAATGDPSLAARLHAAETAAWGRARDHHESATVAAILAAAGVDAARADEVFHRGYDAWWDPHTIIDPDVPALFATLRDWDIRIGVLSNTIWSRDRHERIFARDEVLSLIDGAVYTSELPVTKPHPDAFHAALAAVQVTDAAQAVFVGDRLFDDVHGAQSVGMRAVWVPHSAIPSWQRGPVEGEPDAVIDRLSDLVPIIDAWR